MADPRALDQVFTNLLSNAMEAMLEKAGIMALKVARSPLANGRMGVQVSISDTGAGIPEEARAKIFEPYYTTRPGGTG